MLGFSATLIASLLIGLQPGAAPMRLLDDKEAMTQEVLKFISLGMPIAKIKLIMEANGFACGYNLFDESRRLYCYATKRKSWLVSQNINVFVSYDNSGKATEIRVDSFGMGP